MGVSDRPCSLARSRKRFATMRASAILNLLYNLRRKSRRTLHICMYACFCNVLTRVPLRSGKRPFCQRANAIPHSFSASPINTTARLAAFSSLVPGVSTQRSIAPIAPTLALVIRMQAVSAGSPRSRFRMASLSAMQASPLFSAILRAADLSNTTLATILIMSSARPLHVVLADRTSPSEVRRLVGFVATLGGIG